MKHQAIIFDLDGTLTDSQEGILSSARFALEQMRWGIPNEAVMRKFLGTPLMFSFQEYCGMTEQQAAKAQDIYRDYYWDTGYLQNQVYPGVRQLLHTLKTKGYYLGVATHKPLKPSVKILEAFNLLQYFDKVAGPEADEDPSKGELVLRANPDRLPGLMIGDRATDIKGAQHAGMDGVAALYGYGHREEFEACGTKLYIESADDIYKLLNLQKESLPGYFISFEGNDGSGKSTQARLLAKRLEQSGYEVVLTREPGGTKVGEKIRDILLDRDNNDMDNLTEAMLYAAARAQHVRQVIKPALRQGKLVISDRFVDSSIAYQGAGRGLGLDLVQAINSPAVAGCMPNLTVFLKLTPQMGLERFAHSREQDRLELAGEAFHQTVAAAFDEMIAKDKRFLPISSKGTKQETAQQVFEQVSLRLQEAGLP